MFATRARRRVVVLAVVTGAGLAIGWYRRQALVRNTEEFHARYG